MLLHVVVTVGVSWTWFWLCPPPPPRLTTYVQTSFVIWVRGEWRFQRFARNLPSQTINASTCSYFALRCIASTSPLKVSLFVCVFVCVVLLGVCLRVCLFVSVCSLLGWDAADGGKCRECSENVRIDLATCSQLPHLTFSVYVVVYVVVFVVDESRCLCCQL